MAPSTIWGDELTDAQAKALLSEAEARLRSGNAGSESKELGVRGSAEVSGIPRYALTLDKTHLLLWTHVHLDIG